MDVGSAEFDKHYQHGMTTQLKEMVETTPQVEKEMLTFGIENERPVTAEKREVPLGDSSLVEMGQITADRKGHILTNQFELEGLKA